MSVPAAPQHGTWPDERGRFGDFGGRFVPETLMSALAELQRTYLSLREDPGFWRELAELMANFGGRPTPLYEAQRLREAWGGPRLWLKREDLNHTGSHKLNNCLGQALLARRLGKKRVLAETGAGQHGVATATVAARFGLECRVFMGAEDVRRQALNVRRMELLGAEVVAVESGSRTLKDATNEALREWVSQVDEAHYILGSVVGPHPYPMMVRDFQSVIGREVLAQLGHAPATAVACVGGGSNAAGLFAPLAPHETRLVGVEAGGEGERHCSSLSRGTPGVLHGSLTYLLQDDQGQVLPTHSISAGLDYPGVGPEHSYWKDSGRIEYVAATDQEALEAFSDLCRLEGIMPALESSHALAWVRKTARTHEGDLVVCLSGRGDKDIEEVLRLTR